MSTGVLSLFALRSIVCTCTSSSAAGGADGQPFFEEWIKHFSAQAGPCAKNEGHELLFKARERLAHLPPGGQPDALARKFLLRALRVCAHESAVVDEVGEGLRLLGEPAVAAILYSCATSWGHWRHPLQRVIHDFKPWLPSAAVLEEDVFVDLPELRDAMQIVESGWKHFRSEVFRAKSRIRTRANLQACGIASGCWRPALGPKVSRWQYGSWTSYYVAYSLEGYGLFCNRVMFPHVCDAIDRVKNLGLRIETVGVSEVYGPRTLIPMHRSHIQERLRLFCVIHVPANSSTTLRFPEFFDRQYMTGKCYWHDESYEHELLHSGGHRVSLTVDVWHPALDGRILKGDWMQARISGLSQHSERKISRPTSHDVDVCLGIHGQE